MEIEIMKKQQGFTLIELMIVVAIITNTQAGISSAASISGNYVDQVNVNGGVLEIRYSSTTPQRANNTIDADILFLSPVTNDGSVDWNCRSTDISPKHLPSACR
jgi:type IV pilus assembly protein PilA